MNREIKNATTTEPTNTKIYYAPVASTEGETVKIYRYGFEQQCALFAHDILNEPDELKQCVIRYKFTKFIINHYASYAGNRLEYIRGAALMIAQAHYTLENTLFRAKHGQIYYTNLLNKLKQKHKAVLPQIERQPNNTTHLISTNNKAHNTQCIEVQKELGKALSLLRKYHRLYNRYLQVCSEHIAGEIADLDLYLESFRLH